jgi:hypothetical protein
MTYSTESREERRGQKKKGDMIVSEGVKNFRRNRIHRWQVEAHHRQSRDQPTISDNAPNVSNAGAELVGGSTGVYGVAMPLRYDFLRKTEERRRIGMAG